MTCQGEDSDSSVSSTTSRSSLSSNDGHDGKHSLGYMFNRFQVVEPSRWIAGMRIGANNRPSRLVLRDSAEIDRGWLYSFSSFDGMFSKYACKCGNWVIVNKCDDGKGEARINPDYHACSAVVYRQEFFAMKKNAIMKGPVQEVLEFTEAAKCECDEPDYQRVPERSFNFNQDHSVLYVLEYDPTKFRQYVVMDVKGMDEKLIKYQCTDCVPSTQMIVHKLESGIAAVWQPLLRHCTCELEPFSKLPLDQQEFFEKNEQLDTYRVVEKENWCIEPGMNSNVIVRLFIKEENDKDLCRVYGKILHTYRCLDCLNQVDSFRNIPYAYQYPHLDNRVVMVELDHVESCKPVNFEEAVLEQSGRSIETLPCYHLFKKFITKVQGSQSQSAAAAASQSTQLDRSTGLKKRLRIAFQSLALSDSSGDSVEMDIDRNVSCSSTSSIPTGSSFPENPVNGNVSINAAPFTSQKVPSRPRESEVEGTQHKKPRLDIDMPLDAVVPELEAEPLNFLCDKKLNPPVDFNKVWHVIKDIDAKSIKEVRLFDGFSCIAHVFFGIDYEGKSLLIRESLNLYLLKHYEELNSQLGYDNVLKIMSSPAIVEEHFWCLSQMLKCSIVFNNVSKKRFTFAVDDVKAPTLVFGLNDGNLYYLDLIY